MLRDGLGSNVLWLLPVRPPEVHAISMLSLLQPDAEAKQRAEQGPLFKPRTPEIDYEIGSRHRKAENNALARIQHEPLERDQFPSIYDEAAGQVAITVHF